MFVNISKVALIVSSIVTLATAVNRLEIKDIKPRPEEPDCPGEWDFWNKET